MCSIFGILYFDRDRSVGAEELERANRVLRHRGPDDSGIWHKGQIGLAVNRLNIVDLDKGNQPMEDQAGQCVIAFNGEIYNYAEIRQGLMRRGCRFRTRCDTEVALYALKIYGPSALQYFQGMFALAFWDNKTKELILARDRVGEKPLVYAVLDKAIIFASEIKAILDHALYDKEIDLLGLQAYFLYDRYAPHPQTMFRKIRKLKPASYLVIKDRKIQEQRYWTLPLADSKLSQDQALDQIETALNEAVRQRCCHGQVPVGVMFSGGIDSSLLLAIGRQFNPEIKAYTLIPTDQALTTNSKRALRAARLIGVPCHEIKFSFNDFLKKLPYTISHYDEPIGDPSAVLVEFMAQEMRQDVKVVLHGSGADEAFAGYEGFVSLKRKHYIGSFIRGVLPVLRMMRKLPVPRFKRLGLESESSIAQQVLKVVSASAGRIASSILGNAIDSNESAQYQSDILSDVYNHFGLADCDSVVDFHCYSSLLFSNTHCVVTWPDIGLAAYGLEGRAPFLCHILIEKSAQVPVSMKIKGWDTRSSKYVLKKLLEKYLPRDLIYVRKKGFHSGLSNLLALGEQKFVDFVLSGYCVRDGLLDREGVQEYLRQWSRQERHSGILRLLPIEIWYRLYFCGQHPGDLALQELIDFD